MKTRIVISILIFILLILLYSALFVALMASFEDKNYNFIDGFYWVISTITTVGYGDIHFTTQPGKVFSIVVMISGVLYFFGFFVPYVVIPWAEQRFRLVFPRKISGIQNHIMVCGYNLYTEELCKMLEEFQIPYVVLEKDAERLKEGIDRGLKVVQTDGSLESFKDNGVERATAILIAWREIGDILDTLLTIKDFDVRKYVIYGDHRYSRYLYYSGAEKVFLPKSLIASGIARTILGEISVGRVTKILENLYVSEIIIPRKMAVSNLESKGVKVISVCRLGKLFLNPPPDHQLEKGCIAIVAGDKKAIESVIYEGAHPRLR